MKFLELKNKLKTENYPALCLYGNDNWVKSRAVDYICQAYGATQDDFGMDRLTAPAFDDIRAACLTPSMFGERKVVLCTDFVPPDGNRSAQFKRDMAALCRAGDGSFCAVFLADSDKGFAGIEGVTTVDCNRLPKDSVISWIMSYCKRQGVAVDRLSADRLATYCLQDMARVETEIRKLADYGTVSIESIDLLVHRDAEYAVFTLSDAIASKNASRALEIYDSLISRGETPRGLLTLVYNYYRRVYYVRIGSGTDDELAKRLNVQPTAIYFARKTAARYKPMQLKRALDRLAEADVRLKEFGNENAVLRLVIMQLLSL